VRTAPRARIRDVDDIPAPRWDLTPIERYLDGGFSFGVDRGRTMPLLATRGCPYSCTFCSSPKMWTTRYTTRRPVWSSTRSRSSSPLSRREHRLLRPHGDHRARLDPGVLPPPRRAHLRVTWQLPSGTRSEALDEETLRAMYRSGCRNVRMRRRAARRARSTRSRRR
jgi:pyruvate-formate lyase-activating enzyme